MTTQQLLELAKDTVEKLKGVDGEKINRALLKMADALIENTEKILRANELDVSLSKEKLSPAMIDRLTLTSERICAMAQGIREIASLPSPLGKKISTEVRPNGLIIDKVSVAMGVIAIIYESRPNVTSDASALALKSGSVCVLRGGKEAYNSSRAIVDAIGDALEEAGLPRSAVLLISDTTRESANELMRARGYVDLLIPRGGKGLISACVENAEVPCLQTGTGICHIYVDRDADIEKALNIIENAKTSRPSVCNAVEVCLVDRAIAKSFLPLLKNRLSGDGAKRPVELRLSGEALQYVDGKEATDEDFDTEFLDYILAVDVVGGVEEATRHISKHSTMHSEAIISENADAQRYFTTAIDSAVVYVNASTRFTDGGEFGLGCEMGISTQKLHARGPVGINELTTYKYIVRGNGQVR